MTISKRLMSDQAAFAGLRQELDASGAWQACDRGSLMQYRRFVGYLAGIPIVGTIPRRRATPYFVLSLATDRLPVDALTRRFTADPRSEPPLRWRMVFRRRHLGRILVGCLRLDGTARTGYADFDTAVVVETMAPAAATRHVLADERARRGLLTLIELGFDPVVLNGSRGVGWSSLVFGDGDGAAPAVPAWPNPPSGASPSVPLDALDGRPAALTAGMPDTVRWGSSMARVDAALLLRASRALRDIVEGLPRFTGPVVRPPFDWLSLVAVVVCFSVLVLGGGFYSMGDGFTLVRDHDATWTGTYVGIAAAAPVVLLLTFMLRGPPVSGKLSPPPDRAG